MAPRYRKALSLRPVHSNKEIVDGVFLGVASGTTTTAVVAQSVNDYLGAVGTCPIGSSIKALWIELSYQVAVSNARVDWYLAKNPGGNLTLPIPGATGGNNNRKWLFNESKGLSGLTTDIASKKQGWIKIPQKMRRMGEDDTLEIHIGSSTIYSACFKIIYKWFS